MIKIQRKPKPKILQRNENTWIADIQTALDSGNENALDIAISKYKHKNIKEALISICKKTPKPFLVAILRQKQIVNCG